MPLPREVKQFLHYFCGDAANPNALTETEALRVSFYKAVAVFVRRAVAALDRLPPRLDSPLVFAGPRGGVLNLDNFRRREWAPAIDAAGIDKPARIYDLRSTFASYALAAGVAPFALARIMGTSIPMIERSYGALITGAGDGIAARLDRLEERMGQERAAVEGER